MRHQSSRGSGYSRQIMPCTRRTFMSSFGSFFSFMDWFGFGPWLEVTLRDEAK